MKKLKISQAVWWIGLCEAVGLTGTPFTLAAIPQWYAALNKPAFAPPNWLFGPVWTILYALMGLAAAIIWSRKNNNLAKKLFVGQLALNGIWTPVFFGLRSPVWGLLVIALMWWMIVLTIREFYKISKPAAYLLIPYIAWVSLATLLNAAIVALN